MQSGNAFFSRDLAEQRKHAIENAALGSCRHNQAVHAVEFFRCEQETIVVKIGLFEKPR